MTARRTASGLSMVEMLVALAIASLVMASIGSLIAFAAEVRDRAKIVAEIERAVLDLTALSVLIEEAGFEQARPLEAGFELSRRRNPASDMALRIRLSEALVVAGASSVPPAVATPLAALDQFEDAQLDYLVQAGSQWQWQAGGVVDGSRVRAARLVIKHKHRAWPIVLWTEPLGVQP